MPTLAQEEGSVAEQSSLRLAEALEEAGFGSLADQAREDVFHDFRSPHEAPQHALVAELYKYKGTPKSEAAHALAHRVIKGEFDATVEESDAWVDSEEGQAALGALRRRVSLSIDLWAKVLYALDCFAVGVGGILDGEVDETLSKASALDLGRLIREQIKTETAVDPRELGGSMVSSEDDPMGYGNVILDASKAILVDGLDVALVDDWSSRGQEVFVMLSKGRINQSKDRAQVMMMGNMDWLSAVTTQISGVVERAGLFEEFSRLCDRRWSEMPHPGEVSERETQHEG